MEMWEGGRGERGRGGGEGDGEEVGEVEGEGESEPALPRGKGGRTGGTLLVEPAEQEQPARGRGEAVVVAGAGRCSAYLGRAGGPLESRRVELVHVIEK